MLILLQKAALIGDGIWHAGAVTIPYFNDELVGQADQREERGGKESLVHAELIRAVGRQDADGARAYFYRIFTAIGR